jgi:hypothetical protein
MWILIIVILVLIFLYINSAVVVMSICGNVDDVEDVKKIWKGKLVVYDKCNECQDTPNCKVLPNIGREQHTWLTYVIDNYYLLPNEIFFLPAPIYKHDRLKKFQERSTNPEILGIHENFILDEWNDFKLEQAPIRPMRAWFEKYIGTWNPYSQCVSLNGYMRVTRNGILKRPRKFYIELRKQFGNFKETEVGHYFERAMGEVFSVGMSGSSP